MVAGRVLRAREIQADRLAGAPWQVNAEVPGPVMRRGPFRLPREATADLDRAVERGALTLRGYDRVLKLAWTVRDLDGGGTPTRLGRGSRTHAARPVGGGRMTTTLRSPLPTVPSRAPGGVEPHRRAG